MIKTISTILFFSWLAYPVILLASDSYQYEGAVSYSSKDEDDFIDTTVIGGSVTLFLEPVTYGDRPYNETGFLARKTNVTFAVGQIEYGIGAIDVDTLALSAGFEYMLPESSLVFGAAFTTAEGDETVGPAKIDANLSEAGVSIGYFLDPLSRLKLIVKNSELEFDISTGGGATLDTESITLEYVSVMQLSNGNYAGLSASWSNIDFEIDPEKVDINLAQAGGDYYFTRTTSFGGNIAYLSSDEIADGTSLALRFRHFVDRFTSVELQFDKFTSKASDSDSDTTSIKFLHRY